MSVYNDSRSSNEEGVRGKVIDLCLFLYHSQYDVSNKLESYLSYIV